MADLSLNSRQHLDNIVTQFEESWQRSVSNQIEKVLDQHSEIDRSALLTELLLVEFELVAGTVSPQQQLADYVRRFPQDALLILDVWDKFAASSLDGTSPEANLSTPIGFMDATVHFSPCAPIGTEVTQFDGGGQRPKMPAQHVIGRYRVIEKIGCGGMGVVYRAFDPQTKREVALKVIQSGLMASSEEKLRFQREAEAVSKLNHPNIVPVYDCQLSDEQSFFAMQLINGDTLKERISERLFSAEAAASLTVDLADAMQHAHDRSIVHRDLKPANVLLEADSNHPLILDFGLAFDTRDQQQLTRTGDILGTPQFMSPEQALGAAGSSQETHKKAVSLHSGHSDSQGKVFEIDGRTDVYGLGALLYYMLTGTAPFNAATPLQVLDKVANEDPPSLSGNSDVPQDLATICSKCLQKSPADRYATAQELSDDLNRFLQHKPIHARRTSLARRVRQWALRNPWPTRFITTLLITAISAIGAAFAFQGIAISESDARLQAEDSRRRAERARLKEAEAKQQTEKVNLDLKNAIARLHDENIGRTMAVNLGALAVRDFDLFHKTADSFELLNRERNPSQASLMRTALEAHNQPRLIETKRLQPGHWDVSSADISRDGKRLVTLDGASVISVFDVKKFRLLHRLTNGFLLAEDYKSEKNQTVPAGYTPHYSDLLRNPGMKVDDRAEYTSVAWIGNPEKVLVTQQDGKCLLLNPEQPVGEQVKAERVLWGSPQPLIASCANQAGDHVLVGDSSGQVTLLSLDAKPVMATVKLDSAVTCIQSWESGWLVGTQSGRLTVLSADVDEIANVETGAAIWSVAVHDTQFAVANDSSVISVYEWADRLKLKHKRSFDQPVELGVRIAAFVSIQFFGGELWAFDNEGRVYTWSSDGIGERIGTACVGIRRRNSIIERCPRYRRVVFAEPVEDEMLIADQAGMIRFLQVKRPAPKPRFEELPTRLARNPRIAYAIDGQQVLWGIDDSGVLSAIDIYGRLIDSTQAFPAINRDEALEGTVKALYPSGTDLTVMTDGSVLTVGLEPAVGRWKLENARIVQQSKRYFSQHELMSVAVSEEQQLVASVDIQSNVNVWDLRTGRRIRVFPINKGDKDPSAPLTGRLAFNANGTRLAAFGTGQSSRIFNTSDWNALEVGLQTAGDGGVDVVWGSHIPGLMVQSDTRRTSHFLQDNGLRQPRTRNPGTQQFANNQLLLSAQRSGRLLVKSPRTGEYIFQFNATEGPVCDVTADECAGVILCRTDGTILKQFVSGSRRSDLPITELAPRVLDVVPKSAGYRSLSTYMMHRDVLNRLSFSIRASDGNHDTSGDALLAKRGRDEWSFEVTFSDDKRPVFAGRIAWSPTLETMAFRVVTDPATYCGDLILIERTRSGWREELIHGGANTGLNPLIHRGGNGFALLHQDANYRDIVLQKTADAGSNGWPLTRLARKSGSAMRGKFHKGNTWILANSCALSAARTPQMFVWDGQNLKPQFLPSDMQFFGDLRFSGSDEPTLLCHSYGDGTNSIRVCRNDEWGMLAKLPKLDGVSMRPDCWTFASKDTIVVPLVLSNKIAVMIHRNGQWSETNLNCDLGGRRLAIRAIEVDEDGLTTIIVAPGEGEPNWLKALEFQLP